MDQGVRSVGDVDNAVVTLRFSAARWDRCMSVVLRATGTISVEVIGEEGRQIGRFRHTPVRLLDRRGVHHDMDRTTPDRLGEAFVTELQAFVDCIAQRTVSPISGHESRATVALGLAATQSMHAGRPVKVALRR